MPNVPADYAVYKGDEFICLGTAKECAAYLGVKPESIQYLTTPTYKKRLEKRWTRDPLIAFKIEDESEDDE